MFTHIIKSTALKVATRKEERDDWRRFGSSSVFWPMGSQYYSERIDGILERLEAQRTSATAQWRYCEAFGALLAQAAWLYNELKKREEQVATARKSAPTAFNQCDCTDYRKCEHWPEEVI